MLPAVNQAVGADNHQNHRDEEHRQRRDRVFGGDREIVPAAEGEHPSRASSQRVFGSRSPTSALRSSSIGLAFWT